MKLLAVDPGVRCCGWALFQDTILEDCGLVRIMAKDYSDISAFRTMANNFPRADWLAIEVPRIYERRKSKGDPEDILRLAILCGVLIGRWPSSKIQAIRPRDWKGTIAKARITDYVIHLRNLEALRGRGFSRYVAAMDAIPKSLAHNVADAVGIGLWAL